MKPTKLGERNIRSEEFRDQTKARDTLRLAIKLTIDPETKETISDRRFAEQVLRVNERTLRRYLAADRAIPGPVVGLCEAIIAKKQRDHGKRRKILNSRTTV